MEHLLSVSSGLRAVSFRVNRIIFHEPQQRLKVDMITSNAKQPSHDLKEISTNSSQIISQLPVLHGVHMGHHLIFTIASQTITLLLSCTIPSGKLTWHCWFSIAMLLYRSVLFKREVKRKTSGGEPSVSEFRTKCSMRTAEPIKKLCSDFIGIKCWDAQTGKWS